MNIGKQIAALQRMTVTELRKKHLEAFGEPNRSGHKDYLVKRIAWRFQARVKVRSRSGPVSERRNWPMTRICVVPYPKCLTARPIRALPSR